MNIRIDEWHFCGEREQDGLIYLLGRREHDPAIYRWEPLSRPLRGFQAGEFSKTLNQRCQVLTACQNQGLLRVLGPIRHENRLWVGWQDPGGRNPFTPAANSDELTTLVRDLLPLIRAYEIVHLAGLIIGMPDWGRLTRSPIGYQLPDPWLKDYLARPASELPSGLLTVYPPELSQGAPFSQAVDRFYLGLLLYCLIGGKIPYPLKNRWPHRLLTERSIPLTYCQPQLNPALSNLIADLLASDPEDRPSLREVRLQWQKSLDQAAHLASAHDYAINRQKGHHYSVGLRLNEWLSRIKIPLVIIVTLGMLGSGYAWWQNRPGPSADQMVKALFKAPLSATPLINPAGCSDLIAKFTTEKERRSGLVKELTTQPYVKIKSLKVLSRLPRQTALVLTLEWWTWEQGHWRKTINQEKMVLGKHHRAWKILRTQTISRNQ
jgi:hypothetical protein